MIAQNGDKPDDPPPLECSLPVCEAEFLDNSQDSDGPTPLESDDSDSEDGCPTHKGSSFCAPAVSSSHVVDIYSPKGTLTMTPSASLSAVADRSPAIVVAKLCMLNRRQCGRRRSKAARHRDSAEAMPVVSPSDASSLSDTKSSKYNSCVVDSGTSTHVLGSDTVQDNSV